MLQIIREVRGKDGTGAPMTLDSRGALPEKSAPLKLDDRGVFLQTIKDTPKLRAIKLHQGWIAKMFSNKLLRNRGKGTSCSVAPLYTYGVPN